jgi:hypothetical protein
VLLLFTPWGLDPVGIAAQLTSVDGLRPVEAGATQPARPLHGRREEQGAGAGGGPKRR